MFEGRTKIAYPWRSTRRALFLDYLKDGGKKLLRNVGYISIYTASYIRSLESSDMNPFTQRLYLYDRQGNFSNNNSLTISILRPNPEYMGPE
jgi:hypothetical protein